MRGKLYARELLRKIVTQKELEILEVVWDDDLNIEQKIEALVEE